MSTSYLLEEENKIINNEDSPIIESTKEYGVFKTLEGNRQVSENHVKNLIDFIQRRNLLKYNPILVNEEFEVIDGQHRLEAAKQLQIPIYYIMGTGLSYKDAGVLNACSDDWEFKEYLDVYLKNGHEEYIKLDRFKKEHNLTLKRFHCLVSKEQKRIFDETFKIGTFKIVDDLKMISKQIEKMNDIIGFLEIIIIPENKRFIYTDSFWKALYLFLNRDDIDSERLKEKIGIKYQSIRQMSGYKEYMKCFLEIYNWKAKIRAK